MQSKFHTNQSLKNTLRRKSSTCQHISTRTVTAMSLPSRSNKTSLRKTLSSGLQMLLAKSLPSNSSQSLYRFLLNTRTFLNDSTFSHGKEFSCMVLQVLERLCLQKLLPRNATPPSSTYLPLLLCPSIMESLRRVLESYLRWQEPISQQLFSLTKLTL